ncbi:MAG TPA: hypothetical protein VIV11_23055 [Kofleriaceae bacterium]
MARSIVFAVTALGASQHASAGVGLEAGARVGLDFDGNQDWFVGADVRLTFPSSPLAINPTFDYFFLDDQTLSQVGVNARVDLRYFCAFVDDDARGRLLQQL